MQRGIQIHWLDNLTSDTNTYTLLKQMRPQIVRTPLDYNGIVNTGGAPNWGWYDGLFALVRTWGGKVLLITPECESGYRTPNTVMDGNLFALSQGAAGRYPDAMFELGNEPNAQVGANQPISASLHIQYCRGVAASIRLSNPNAAIVSGGLSGLDLNYLQQEISGGLFSVVPIAGIHPYGQTDFGAACETLQAHLSGVPFWFTELGNNTSDDAAQLAMMQAYFRASVPVAVWYSLYGDQGFSMVRAPYPLFYS